MKNLFKVLVKALDMWFLAIGVLTLIYGLMMYFQPVRVTDWFGIGTNAGPAVLIIPGIILIAIAVILDKFSK